MKKITLFIASLFIAMASFAEIKVDTLWQKTTATGLPTVDSKATGISYDNGQLLVPTRLGGDTVASIYDAATGNQLFESDGTTPKRVTIAGLGEGCKSYGADFVTDDNGAVYYFQRISNQVYKRGADGTYSKFGGTFTSAWNVNCIDVYVDANNNGCVVAPRSNGDIYYLPITAGVAGEWKTFTQTTGSKTQVRANIVDATHIWIDGTETLPVLVTLKSDLSAIESEKTLTSTMINAGVCGVEQFSVLGYNYLACATNNHSTTFDAPNHSFVIFQLNDDGSITPVTSYLPTQDWTPNTADSFQFLETNTVVNGSEITVYVCAGYNGLAAYKLSGFPEKTFACSTVAEVKAIKDANAKVTLNSDAVVTFIVNDGIVIEDATGAIKCQSYAWPAEEKNGLVAGKKITSVSGYANYEEEELDWWGEPTGNKITYSGVIYTPETEKVTYTLGDSVGVTYATTTAAQILADPTGYQYKAVKIVDATLTSGTDGYVIATETGNLSVYYDGGALPSKVTLYGYYGPHPYGEEYYGKAFIVSDIEVEEIVLNNANIITEYDSDDYAEVKSVMVGDKKVRLSRTENKLPRIVKTLKGYYANETYYYYDVNGDEVQGTREILVVTDFTYETIAINDYIATTEGSYKYITYNGEKLRLQAEYGVTIPGMGNVTGFVYDAGSYSGVMPCFWVLSAEGTGYSNINEYKTAVGAGKTAEKAATIVDPMLISYVYTAGEQTTLFVKQGNYYAAIRTTATDKNGKTYAAGDSIKGVKGIMTAFGYDQTAAEIITGTYLTVEAGVIEITSSANAVPTATSLYGIEYLTGSSKRSAGSYEARYSTVPVGELKKIGNDCYFFSSKGDSILVVAPFAITDAMLGKVGLKAFTDVKNTGDKVQLILTAESDIIPSNVKFTSVADMIAAGSPASGITYELTTPVLLTYIQESYQTNWSTMEDIPQYYLYVQDATGAMRVQLDTAATRVFTPVVGDSIVGLKGEYNQYNGFQIKGTDVNYSVKNSNNPLVPKVITIKEYLEAQTAGTYNAMLVRFEGVEFVERDTTVWSVNRKDRDFIQGDYKITYSKSNFEDYLGKFTFYPVNNITAIADKSWMTSQYGFMPINQDAIENAVSKEEGATIESIRNNTESKDVKFTGTATSTYLTNRGVIVQDGTGAILLDGLDTLALDRSVTNIEGTYHPSSVDCMARIVVSSYEDKGRGRLSKETVTIDSLVNNIANFEGEIVDIAVAKTARIAEGVYTMTTTDGKTIAVRGDVVPADAKFTGLIYHTSAEQGQAFTVTAYDLYNTGSNRVLMFHELKDYMAKWAPVTTEQYSVSGFTSPVLVNSVFSAQGGTALNVQQTNADGTITGLTVWTMELAEGVTFEAGDSIYFVKGGYYPYQDLSAVYGAEGYARGRSIQAYRYDYHVGDIDYPADTDSILNDDGEMILPPIVEVQLGTLIQKLNSGNEFSYTKISDISGFFGKTAVDYQAKNYEVTGTIVVDTTSYEWDGEITYEYATYIKVGENKLLLSGADLKLFANQEITIKGNFDIGYALEDRASLYIPTLANVDAGIALAANIAEFIELANTEEEVLILSELAVTYQNGANIYVRDNSGSLLIYDFDYQNAGYVNGDRLTGVKGKFKDYNGLPEMVEATLPAAVAGDPVAPRAISVAELATADLSEYVVINEVRFAENLAFTADSRNASIANNAGETAALYNNFKLEASWGTQTPVSIIGTVGIYKENRQLNYISHDMFAVDFADIAAIYNQKHWEESRYADYTYQSLVARLESQPTVVDVVKSAGMMGGSTNNYYLNDGTGVVVLQAPATGLDWMGETVEGLELTVGQKLPAGLLAYINFNAVVNDTTYLPTGENFGAPVLTFVQKVTGVDADGWDTYQPYSEFAATCVESDFIEDTIVVSLAEVLANRIDYAGKLLAVDTIGNYFAEVAMDHFSGTTSTTAYLYWEADSVFDVETWEEEGETFVYVSPKMTEDWSNYAGELFNLKGENLPAAALADAATIALDVVRFDWNSIALSNSLILKGEYTVENPNSPEVNVEDNFNFVANVYSNNGSVYVEAQEGAMIEIYTVNGLRVYAGVSNTTTTVINGLNTNVVIIRVNGEAHKVMVK